MNSGRPSRGSREASPAFVRWGFGLCAASVISQLLSTADIVKMIDAHKEATKVRGAAYVSRETAWLKDEENHGLYGN